MNLSQLKLALRYENMTVRQLAVLLALGKQKILMRNLSLELQSSKASMTRSCDRLCELGLVKRERSDDDRRDVFAYLTEKGHDFVKRTVA